MDTLAPAPNRRLAVAGLVTLLALGAPPAASGRPATPSPHGDWAAPVSPVTVVRGFDPPSRPWLAGHRGVDLRTRPGSTVRAAGSGRVAYVGVLAGRGVVVIDHGTLRTTYEPVDADVAPGQHVDRGEPLGRIGVGTGHCGTGSCLHLGLKRGDAYLDPRLVLARSRAVLRPW